MTSKKNMQKQTICIALIVALIALVAVFTVVGAPLQQVAMAQGTVAFNAVTDPSQIAEENIGECTFADAKEWVLDNWDEVREIINDDRSVVLYYHNNESLCRIMVTDGDTYTGKDAFTAEFNNDEEKTKTIADCQEQWDYYGALYFCDPDNVAEKVEVSDVKWESADIPAVDRRLTADDMEGFIPTTREIAIQWLPPENAQRTLLIYDVGEDYIATIEYSGGRYWSDDVNHDTITCENFLEMRELGVVLYYTGVKENSGIVTPSKVAEPIILPEGEVQNGTVAVRLFCETDGATIYYTLDGSIPNEHSRVYEPGSTVTVSENATIRAIAMKAGMEKSVMASESFNSGAPSGKGSGKSDNIIQYEGDPIPGKETGKAKHGFCVGWVVFIFAILELLYLGLYFVLWFPKAAFLIDKCKLGALKSIKEGKILFGVVDLLAFIGLCVSCGVFLFALIALCCHACAVTAVSFVLALLVLAAFVAIFVLDHKDLVKGWMEKICKKEKKGEKTEVAPESTELPAEEKVPTDNDQE